jgi:hypothetical protein
LKELSAPEGLSRSDTKVSAESSTKKKGFFSRLFAFEKKPKEEKPGEKQEEEEKLDGRESFRSKRPESSRF